MTPQFTVESKRRSIKSIKKRYPDALIVDVTSRGEQPFVKFSPFYPHGNIPVPFSPNFTAATVEGIWQGLKVFERADVDLSKFTITNMTGIKRSSRTLGNVIGHRAGVGSQTILSYRDSRYQIYLPTYDWVLTHCLQAELAMLQEAGTKQPVILLDYETNTDIDNLTKPLSHAALVVRRLMNADKELSERTDV